MLLHRVAGDEPTRRLGSPQAEKSDCRLESPDVTAARDGGQPTAWVAESNSPRVSPAPAGATARARSTSIRFIGDRPITIPPSHTDAVTAAPHRSQAIMFAREGYGRRDVGSIAVSYDHPGPTIDRVVPHPSGALVSNGPANDGGEAATKFTQLRGARGKGSQFTSNSFSFVIQADPCGVRGRSVNRASPGSPGHAHRLTAR
jgi:hypothetical protein